MTRALILVDIQNDFMPTGALPVNEGDVIVPIVNTLMPLFDLVVATQDFHPADHGSFASQYEDKDPGEFVELGGLTQILWPDHCVQDTQGAQFHPSLDITQVARVFPKGTDVTIDSYSGFFDNGHKKSTGLSDYLKSKGVTSVHVVGLATDYCVKFTALDAVGEGFETTLVVDACRGVNIQPTDSTHAVDAMKDAGVKIVQSDQVR